MGRQETVGFSVGLGPLGACVSGERVGISVGTPFGGKVAKGVGLVVGASVAGQSNGSGAVRLDCRRKTTINNQ